MESLFCGALIPRSVIESEISSKNINDTSKSYVFLLLCRANYALRVTGRVTEYLRALVSSSSNAFITAKTKRLKLTALDVFLIVPGHHKWKFCSKLSVFQLSGVSYYCGSFLSYPHMFKVFLWCPVIVSSLFCIVSCAV